MSGRIHSAGGRRKFSSYLSCQRLRNVQKLLKDSRGEKNGPDVILAVLGIDGKFNEGCRELANYLTCGFFSSRQIEFEKAGLEEEDVEDVVFLVRDDSVSVYCGAQLHNFLLPCIANWKNLQVYCRDSREDEQDRDTDVEESYKVKSFISMIQGAKTIGIPYLGSNTSPQEKAKQGGDLSIEKWPLIQSYASKDIGCGKLFNIDHNVCDVRSQFLSLYNECGPFVLEKTVNSSYPLFVRHWDEAVTVIDNAVKGKTLMQVKEDQVLEPLQCYYKHGQLSKVSKKATPDPGRKPYILFGTHSMDFGKDTKSIDLKTGARKGKSVSEHMVMQCVSPNAPLLCTRTYFFRSPGSAEKDYNNLIHLYTTCIQGANLVIDTFASTLSVSKAEGKAIEHLLTKGISCGLVFDAKCTVITCDKLGKKVQIPEGKYTPTVNVVKVSAENIKASHGGDVIGSVMFSETFTISSFEVENGERNTVCNVLTSGIPSYIEWQTETTKSQFADEDPLSLCKDMTICSASELFSPSCTATMQFNQDGTMIISAKNMNDVVLKAGVQYYDSPNPGEVCLIIISFDVPENTQLWSQIPVNFRGEVSTVADVALSTPNKCVVLALLPGTQAYKEFYAVVAHHVQNVPLTPLNIKKASTISSDLKNMYDSIQATVKTHTSLSKDTFSKSTLSVDRPLLGDFLSHMTVAYVANGLPVPASTVDYVLRKKQSSEEKDIDDERVCVNVIFGIPSSGADGINQQLVSLNKEKVRWVVIRPNLTPDSDSTLNKTMLEKQLAQAVTHKRVARPSAASRKRLRIIILSIGFFDVCEIIQCVTHHSDINIREQLFVGAVTHCVSPKSVYFSERQNFPKFFDQCTPGVISNFAFITPEQEVAGTVDKSLAEIQQILRCANKNAAFLICPGGKLIRKTDFDLVLAEDNFSSAKVHRERFLCRPDLCIGKYISGESMPKMSRIILEFSQPLIKGAFSARLRSLKVSVSKPQIFGSISFVMGRVAFTDFPNQEYDISFSSIVHEVEMVPYVVQTTQPAPPSKTSPRKTKPYNLEFYGVNLNEAELKDWLRKCGRQKPSKKCHKTKSNLTKNELQMIQDENCTRHLPEGYFYNGSFYVSLFDDKKMLQHPNMPRFIDEYLKAENQEIDAYNAEIDRQNIKDVFE